jgi:CRP-like cAMP-binding protein
VHAATPTVTSSSKISHVREIDLFDGATPSELGDLARAFTLSTARPGESLEVQDTPVRWWNLIVSGHALVERDGTPLGLLGQGESWSEHSLLNHQRSPIGVVALSPVTVLSVTRRRFFGLCNNDHSLRGRIVARSATSADRLAMPVYRALVHMEEAERRRVASELGW